MPASRAMKEHKRGVEYSAGQIIGLVWEMYREVGEPVTYHRFARWSGIPVGQIYLHFRSWHDVRLAAGLPWKPPNVRCISAEQLLSDLHGVVRRLGRWPTTAEFERLSGRSYHLLNRKVGPWKQVRARYREWVNKRPKDADTAAPADETPAPPKPFDWWNPQQVMESVTQINWMRDAWRRAKVAFELKSSDFMDRSPGDCDFLVVLDHDWPRCPVPVIEFGTVMTTHAHEPRTQ
jgi:hypothetical protein